MMSFRHGSMRRWAVLVLCVLALVVVPHTFLQGRAVSQIRRVVFIDTGVAGWQALANAVTTDAVVYPLDKTRDGVTEMRRILSAGDFHGLTAIQIVSHGLEGEIRL